MPPADKPINVRSELDGLQIRLSVPMQLVLTAFMNSDEDLYGGEVSRITGLKSGTVYPLLSRLERYGILRSYLEGVDPIEAKRPERKYYAVTADAAAIVGRRMALRRGSLSNSALNPLT